MRGADASARTAAAGTPPPPASTRARYRGSRAKGAAARFVALATQLQSHPRLARHRFWLDTVRVILARAKTVVYASKPGEDFVLRVVE